MTILSLETSHETASVALLIGDKAFEKTIISDKRHEETVMPAVSELLEEQGVVPSDIDLVAVDIGPGSFTGIRIGICHANAIAEAVGVPCLGVCALEAMAFFCSEPRPTASMIDAGNENCYGAIYDKNRKAIFGPAAETINGFTETAGRFCCGRIIKDTDGNKPSALTIARIASLYDLTALDGSTRAQPLYLRPSQAERKRGV